MRILVTVGAGNRALLEAMAIIDPRARAQRLRTLAELGLQTERLGAGAPILELDRRAASERFPPSLTPKGAHPGPDLGGATFDFEP